MPGKIVIVGDGEESEFEKLSDSEERSWIEKIKQRPFIVIIPAIGLVFIIVILISSSGTRAGIPANQAPQSETTAQAVVAPSPTGVQKEEKIFNPLSWILPKKEENQQNLPGQSHPTPIAVAPGTNATAIFSDTTEAETTQQGGASVTNSGQSSGGSTGSSASQQTTTSSSSQSTNSSSGPNEFTLVFQSGDQTFVYEPPATPPVDIVWSRYTNHQDNYSLEYPSNWQIVRTQFNGHEAVFVYAPGSDPKDPTVQHISFGWASYYYPPDANYTVPILFQRVPGTIYTNGELGTSYIAAAFQYLGGYFALVNNVSDETFVYIFDHMLSSLQFGG